MSQTRRPSSGSVTSKVEAGIAWVEFQNAVRMNSFTVDMWHQLPEVIDEVQARDDVRVIVLRGAGKKAFSTGADISEFSESRTGDTIDAYDTLTQRAFDTVRNASKPTIAMIYGYCMGGGVLLALSCDIRLAADGSTFAVPAAKLGIGFRPDWIAALLGTVSPSHAKEMLFSGRIYHHGEAERVGLINEAVSGELLEHRTTDLAKTIAKNAPLTIYATKLAINAIASNPGGADYEALSALAEECYHSADYEEGRTAFIEKRPPRFQGR